MSTLLRSLVFAGVLAAPLAAQAATPTLKEVLGASGITAGGYVDAGYNYMSADTGGSLRVFDVEHSEFSLHQVATFLAYQPKEGAGVFVNLTAGEDADLISSNGSFGGGGGFSGDNFDVTQAFAQYAAGPLTLMAGKYVTLNGAEVIDSRGVPNASRGILFGYAIPFTHTGIRGALALGPTTLYAGLNNGWDQLDDTNKGKTGELGVGFGAGPVAVFASGYAGKEVSGVSGIDGLRTISDIVVTLKAGDMLTFIVNGDYGAQEDAMALDDNAAWLGVAGYVNAQLTPKFRASLRAEWFDDKDGFRSGINQAPGTDAGGHEWREVTLTFGAACDEHLDLLFEVRGDQSSEMAFLEDGVATDENTSVNLKALYKF